MSSLKLERLYPLIALGVLAAATVWLERVTRMDEEEGVSALRHDPDLMIHDFTLRRFGKTGTKSYELIGSRLVHFADDDSSLVTAPHLEFSGEGRPLTVTAEQGTVYEQGDRVFLEGSVQALRAADAQHAPMTFRSATLTVWPNEERAETRTPLVMTQGATVIHAQAMEAQNLIGEIKLAGSVSARLQRNKAAKP